MSSEIKKALKTFYDLEAAERDQGSPAEWKNQPKEELLRLVLNEKKSTLLEIGAGTGKDSKYFSDNGLQVVAVDLSTEMVKHCKAKGIEAYELDYANVSSLGRKFDCIWSMNSLLHLEKKELPGVLKVLDSVLNGDGLFYIGVYGGEDKVEYISTEGYTIPRHFAFYSDESLKKILSAYFEIVSFKVIELDRPYHFQSVILRKK